MDSTRPKRTELSNPLRYPSADAIEMELAKLAIRRQASITPADLAVYSEDLAGFLMPDLTEGLRSFVRPRERGETAFPDVGSIIEACKVARGERLQREALEREQRAAQEEAEHRATHPEEYFSIADDPDFKALFEKASRRVTIQ